MYTKSIIFDTKFINFNTNRYHAITIIILTYTPV